MHTLIYLSAATSLFSDEDITAILSVSRRNNPSLDITGLLLYHEGSILQILEGEKETIHKLFNKIGKDPRHKHVIKMFDSSIEERSFQDWSMGFKKVSDNDWSELEGYLNLDDKKKINEVAPAASVDIIRMIRSFSHVNQMRM